MQPRPHLLILGGALLLGGGLFIFLDGHAPTPGPSLGPEGSGSPGQGAGAEGANGGASTREVVPTAGGESSGNDGLAAGPGAGTSTPGELHPPDQETESELEALRRRNLEQRRASFERMIRARAVRIADEVGLGTGAEERIAQVYLDEQVRIDEIRAAYAAGPPSREARTKLREDLRGVKSWRHERFRELFGASTAEAIAAFRDQAAIESAGLVLDPESGEPAPRSGRPE